MADARSSLPAIALRVAVGLMLIALVGVAGNITTGQPATDAALRLTWRATARVEQCRDRSPAELARLAAHLRQPRECLEVPVNYHLRLTIDGVNRVDREFRHHGVRGSRPLFVDHLERLPPGRHRVELSWIPRAPTAAPISPSSAEAASGSESVTVRPTAVRHEVSELLASELDVEVDFPTGHIRLITLDPDLRVHEPDVADIPSQGGI